LQANKDVLAGKVKTSLQYRAIDDDVKMGKNIKINNNSVIGKGCVIEKDTVIEDSVIWAKTIVRKNAKITGSAIGSNCIIEEDTEINNSIVIRDVENISGISEENITKSMD
jgi:NDP-sugar pyrophosphorylase family protein